MRTTVTLDDDVYEAARAQAEASGKTLGQVLSHLARRGLRPSEQAVESTGLPVFKVTADSGIIPSSRARELLAEDAT
jgi:hypothetical protein